MSVCGRKWKQRGRSSGGHETAGGAVGSGRGWRRKASPGAPPLSSVEGGAEPPPSTPCITRATSGDGARQFASSARHKGADERVPLAGCGLAEEELGDAYLP